MPSSRLPNYLRTYRKRSGLSQEEVAYLLGSQCGSKVCRYERFTQQPNLETGLACELLFRTPMRELYAGTHQKVGNRLVKRIQALIRRLNRQQGDSLTHRKLALLTAVIEAIESQSNTAS